MVVFSGVRELCLSNYVLSQPVSSLMQTRWTAYWRREVASFNKKIFAKWIFIIVEWLRERFSADNMIVLFYEAVRSRMTSDVVKKLADRNIAVVALPVHSSDCLQPLDISVFSLFKIYVARSYSAELAGMNHKTAGWIQIDWTRGWGWNRGVS